jgi:electron transfer flavoprotein beta subunit
MNIVILVKQIPDIEKNIKITVDSKSNNINRQGVPSIMNPADKNALEFALQIKDKFDARLTVVSMGPMQAQEVLREALSLGADEAFLASDRVFAGSDTLWTSLVLEKTIQQLPQKPDYIFCGHQALDGDTGQVGPGVAARLKLPQWIHLRQLLQIHEDHLIAERYFDGYRECIEIRPPALLAFVKNSNTPRLPSLKKLFWSKEASLNIINNQALKIPNEFLGINGSPTRVMKTFKIELDKTLIKTNIEQGSEIFQNILSKIGEVK